MPPDEDQLFQRPAERPGPKLQSGEAEFIMALLARLSDAMGTGEVRVRDSVRRRRAGDRGDRGVLALPAEVLGHADVLEPDGDRLALRDRVHSYERVIRSANFPCPRCRCFDAG
jgi:hypothetical protein